MRGIKVLTLLTLALVVLGVRPVEAQRHLRGTIEQLLDLDVRPFAIAHHGFGDNPGVCAAAPSDGLRWPERAGAVGSPLRETCTAEDPSRPIENTVPSVREAFMAGASIVEVDVQLTRDGRVAVFHDDFLSDFTCINQLSLAELQRRLPFVPSLEAVLREARKFNEPSGPLRGLVIVELKALSPLCDPYDTQERAIVTAVSRAVRQMRMTNQVMFTSFSPALLYLTSQHAPEITRDLSILGLQFLTAHELEFLGYGVTVINKKLDLGLQWAEIRPPEIPAEIGPIYRLPGYSSVDEVLATAAVVQARVVEADLLFLQSAGAPFVDVVHAFGLKALGFTATDAADWFFLQSLGLDGVYTDDVPFGVEHEAPIPWAGRGAPPQDITE